jgi:hypothetical protein
LFVRKTPDCNLDRNLNETFVVRPAKTVERAFQLLLLRQKRIARRRQLRIERLQPRLSGQLVGYRGHRLGPAVVEAGGLPRE